MTGKGTIAAFVDDPNWMRFIPEIRETPRTRSVPPHEDCARLEAGAVAAHLSAGGTLGRMPGYEERPGQIDMVSAVTRAFNAREHLMIEAGTGVGKSLAYLVPAVHWAAANDTTVIVSTATRNLQSQLIGADIPRAVKTLGEAGGKFRVALLKGRTNYLCLRAVSEFFAPGYWTMTADEQREMPAFVEWLTHTPDGDLDRYDGLPRALLSCPGEECSARRCPFYARCFVFKARKQAAEANLVVANHALVLAEALSPGSGILPGYARLILDEAHNLENIATEYLSCEFSVPVLTRVLNRLIRRGKGRLARPGGVLSAISRQFQKGAFVATPAANEILSRVRKATRLTVRAVSAAQDLADCAGQLLRPTGTPHDICRFRTDPESGIRAYSLHALFRPYDETSWSETGFQAAENAFEAELAGLVNLLHELRDLLNEATPEGEFNYLADLAGQAGNVADELVDFSNEAHFALAGEKPTHAYWAERVTSPKHPSYVRVVAAPLSVAGDLREALFVPKDSVILASATLRVGNDFKYMAKRLGCLATHPGDEEAARFRFLTAASPFDYFRQALVLAPDCLPEPSANPAGYAEALAALLKDVFAVTQGRALVLFTSYEMMKSVAAQARERFETEGLSLLVQGEGLSRERMTAELKTSPATVLFGAQSFWEGVDVAGEALSCVVLARLPFAQVGDPIIEARSEKIDREGGSSFRDYALPEAVIRFRQGFGRLIRTKSDRGIVLITDPRIVTKNYGGIFRKSIPATVHTVTEIPELLDRIQAFFHQEPEY